MFVIVAIGASLKNYKSAVNKIVEDTSCFENTMRAIDNLSSNNTIILTTQSFHLFDHHFSLRNKKYTNNKYLMFDVWTYYLDPEYLKYLGGECHCDPLDPFSFFNWLAGQNAYYIAEPRRFDLTAKYMDLVHGQKIRFVPIEGFKKPSCLASTNISGFELRRVTIVR